jgi:type VI secretion system secreted protein Hcp
MATNMYLKLDKIEGEATAAEHDKEIEILSWSHGFSQPTSSVRASSGATVEKANHSDISITKYLDSSTDDILKMCWTGKQIKTGVITCLRSDGATDNKYVTYLKIELDEIIISNYSISGGGGDLPVENISLNYGKIKYTYMNQKKEDGTGGNAQPISYDLVTNKVG